MNPQNISIEKLFSGLNSVVTFWNRISSRDRRALIFLFSVGGVIIWVWGVLLPILDRIELGKVAVSRVEKINVQFFKELSVTKRLLETASISSRPPGKESLAALMEKRLSSKLNSPDKIEIKAIPGLETSGEGIIERVELGIREMAPASWSVLLEITASFPIRIDELFLDRSRNNAATLDGILKLSLTRAKP